MANKADSDHPERDYDAALAELNRRISADSEGPDNPLLEAPPFDERELMRCPECDRPVESVGGNMQFVGRVESGDRVAGVTTTETMACHNCNILMDNEKVVRNVE